MREGELEKGRKKRKQKKRDGGKKRKKWRQRSGGVAVTAASPPEEIESAMLIEILELTDAFVLKLLKHYFFLKSSKWAKCFDLHLEVSVLGVMYVQVVFYGE